MAAGDTVPTLVLWSGASHLAAQQANARLAEAVPGATSIAGAAHFMVATHAGEVARRVAAHIDATIR